MTLAEHSHTAGGWGRRGATLLLSLAIACLLPALGWTADDPPAPAPAPAALSDQGGPQEGSPQEGGPQEDDPHHTDVFTPYAQAPGRPAWAPLELSWSRREWWAPLREALRHGDAPTRARAAFGLGLTGCAPAREELARAATDPDRAVREAAALALCYLGDARGEAAARLVYRDGPPWRRYYALVGLWRLDSAPTRRFLLLEQSRTDPFLQQVLPHALASVPWALPLALSDPPLPLVSAPPETLWEELVDGLVGEADYRWHQGEYDQVCRCLEAVLFFSPQRVDDYDSVAWLQWSLGRDGVALETLRRGIAANPESWLAWYNLGFHYFNTKRYSEALEPLRRATEWVGDRGWLPWHTYAHALERTGRLAEAVKVWEETVRRFPADERGRANLERARNLLPAG